MSLFSNKTTWQAVRLCGLAAIAAATLLCLGCITFVSTTNGSLIDRQKAFTFSNSFMEDVVSDREDAMYSKMESEFHQITPRDKFTDLIHTLDDQLGKITSYRFDHDEVGAKILYNGKTKPTRKFVYRVTTTKGTYPLSVQVVPNGNDLAITDFMFRIDK
jgi:hypothetical protein